MTKEKDAIEPQTAPHPFDVSAVRSHFPALSRPNSRGMVPTYFDGPGGTQTPTDVLDAMRDYMISANSNIEGEFEASARTDALIEEARSAGGAFLGGDPAGIAFGQNMTTLNFLISRACGRELNAGDEILTTVLDHDSNVAPWLRLAEDLGVTVRTVGVTKELELDLEDLEASINSRTRVVACTLASNAVGTLTPARQIADAAHSVGALAWFDAVAIAAHHRLDVEELGADVLLCSPYKFYGPHLGVAWIRPDLAAAWRPERVRPASNTPSGHRFETGTLSHEALAGFLAAIGYLERLGSGTSTAERLASAYTAIGAHEHSLGQRFLDGLAELKNWRLLGVQQSDPQRRAATFGLLPDNGTPARWARRMNDSGIYAWNGNFYALNLVRHLGLDEEAGMLRIGINHYNTAEEVDQLLALMAEVPSGH